MINQLWATNGFYTIYVAKFSKTTPNIIENDEEEEEEDTPLSQTFQTVLERQRSDEAVVQRWRDPF